MPPLATNYHWPLFGHNATVAFLQQLVRSVVQDVGRKPQHAYLLLGLRQVGKRTVAEVFAQALLCTNMTTRPCGKCRSCRLFANGNHPDFRRIQPLDRNGKPDRISGMLRAEQASEIIQDVVLRPMEGSYKIFVIQDLHTANDSFANKLLKTLEEPPTHALFLLTAIARDQLLPTIVSRCQLLELRPLAPKTIANALMEQWHVTADEAQLLSRLAQGRLGWAVQQVGATEEQQMRLTQLKSLWTVVDASPADRLVVAEKMASSFTSAGGNRQLFELLETWTTWWRDILLTQSGCVDACCNIDQQIELKRQAALLPQKTVQEYLHILYRIEEYLHHTVNTRLALEVLLLRAPRPASILTNSA